ncbi:MAG TPA: ParB/RepB/Spo0J family partition protein [Candidatus Saccharimonadales bacterium]|nr:ParB/RepB/Spo0J family partition protein [Candidatus Saccharimonadales bacterium]
MSATPKRGLGRGFEALLPSDFDKQALLSRGEQIEELPVEQLQANPHQPRRHFDEAALAELAASIKRHGIVQPLVVTPVKNGIYTLVAGERRWRAAQLAKLKTVPAIVRAREELEQLEVALIENVQRVELGPIEQALSIEKLHEQFSLPYEQIAQRLGKAISTVNNIARLLQLPAPAREALEKGQISEGHARAILALKDDTARQTALLQSIIQQGWSVRQAERFVTGVKAGIKENKRVQARVATETPATKALAKHLGAPVHVRRTARGGKIEIDFKSDDELDQLIKRLGQ